MFLDISDIIAQRGVVTDTVSHCDTVSVSRTIDREGEKLERIANLIQLQPSILTAHRDWGILTAYNIRPYSPLSHFRHAHFKNEAIRPYEYLRWANVVCCCVPCCNNSSEKTSYVSFPKCPRCKALLQKWIVNIRRDTEHKFKVCFVRLLSQLQTAAN